MFSNFYFDLVSIGLPISIQHLVISSGSLVDNLMVGNYGESAIASVGAIDKFVRIFWFVVFGVSGAGSNFVAQAHARKDMKKLGNIVGVILGINLLTALIFTLLSLLFPKEIVSMVTDNDEVRIIAGDYLFYLSLSYIPSVLSTTITYTLRGIKRTKLILYSSLIFVFFNVMLNYLLIFGNSYIPALGVNGAALATVLSKVVETLFSISYLYFADLKIFEKFSDLMGASFDLMKRIVLTSIPFGISSGLLSAGLFTYQIFLKGLGVEALASYAIITNLESFIMNLFHGLSGGTSILLSQDMGKENYDLAYTNAKKSLKISTLFSIIFSTLLFLCSGWVVGQYMNLVSIAKGSSSTNTSVEMCVFLLRTFAIFLPFKVFNLVSLSGVVKSGGDTAALMVIENISIWIFGIPILYLISYFPSYTLYLAYFIISGEEVVKAVLCLWRVRSLKWQRNLVK